MDLPRDLPLPLDSGQLWWYWLGGRPSMDFVNTLRERWWRRVETLVTTGDLVAWLGQAELLSRSAPTRATRDQLAAARRLREAIDAGVVAATSGRPMPVAAAGEIDRWLPAATVAQTLTLDPSGDSCLRERAPDDAVDHALGRVALDAARLLGTDERERARICASERCSARFYDRSPAAGRVWCSMRGCGNVAKARRHRARVRGSEGR